MAVILFLAASLAMTFICVDFARRMAVRRGRARLARMWSAALLGPLPLLVLGSLPPLQRPQAATP